jgi:hypothetical protein
MIISKEEYEKLLNDKFDWEQQANKALAVAKDIAATRDGYVEVCKKLKEYRIPKLIKIEPYQYGEEYWCPTCDHFLGIESNKHKKFCDECGQALKYKEEEKWELV